MIRKSRVGVVYNHKLKNGKYIAYMVISSSDECTEVAFEHSGPYRKQLPHRADMPNASSIMRFWYKTSFREIKRVIRATPLDRILNESLSLDALAHKKSPDQLPNTPLHISFFSPDHFKDTMALLSDSITQRGYMRQSTVGQACQIIDAMWSTASAEDRDLLRAFFDSNFTRLFRLHPDALKLFNSEAFRNPVMDTLLLCCSLFIDKEVTFAELEQGCRSDPIRFFDSVNLDNWNSVELETLTAFAGSHFRWLLNAPNPQLVREFTPRKFWLSVRLSQGLREYGYEGHNYILDWLLTPPSQKLLKEAAPYTLPLMTSLVDDVATATLRRVIGSENTDTLAGLIKEHTESVDDYDFNMARVASELIDTLKEMNGNYFFLPSILGLERSVSN